MILSNSASSSAGKSSARTTARFACIKDVVHTKPRARAPLCFDQFDGKIGSADCTRVPKFYYPLYAGIRILSTSMGSVVRRAVVREIMAAHTETRTDRAASISAPMENIKR